VVERIPSIDTIAVGLAVWLVGGVLGPALGTVMLITFGWFWGMLVGVWLMRADEAYRRIKTAWFVAVSFGVTVGGAGMLANLLAPTLKTHPFELLFFVAVGIPAVGMKWIDLAKWAWGLRRRAVEEKVRGPE
jgi:hypothetical protein